MKLLVILISFGLILVFLAILGSVLEGYWRKYQAARAAARQAEGGEAAAPPVGQTLAGNMARWRSQLQTLIQPDQPNEQLVSQFHTWIQNELDSEKALQSWLLALPEPGFVLLTQHVAAFCEEMNFELAWLFDKQLAVVPELKATMRAVVADYCRACQKSIPVQLEARLFTQYQQLLQAPNGKQEQALRRTLHAQLADQGLVSPMQTSELINATDRERQQQAVEAIQEAAVKDWTQFVRILQTAMTPTTTARAAAATNGTDPAAYSHQNGTTNSNTKRVSPTVASPIASSATTSSSTTTSPPTSPSTTPAKQSAAT